MLICPIKDVAPLLPHSGKMVLLDEIIAYNDQSLCAHAYIGSHHIFLQEDGTVPAWMAVEIMAQCIAALEGCHAHNQGEAVRLGFLLGTRKLHLYRDVLPVGSCLRASARQSIKDQNGFAVFDCCLELLNDPNMPVPLPEPQMVAQAALNVFSPPNLDVYLQQTRGSC